MTAAGQSAPFAWHAGVHGDGNGAGNAGVARGVAQARWLLLAAAGGLALPLALIPIDGAVIAAGELTVATPVSRVAHPRGGVVAAVLVADGAQVAAGQVLLRLDDTVSAATAGLADEGLDRLLARAARLRAVRDGAGTIAFPPELLTRAAQPAVAAAMAEERRTFAATRAAMADQRAALAQQAAQATRAIGSYHAQAGVYRQQEALIAEERAASDRLWERRFTTLQRRNEIARAAIGIRGNVAMAEVQAAQAAGRVAELRQQQALVTSEARRQAALELAGVDSRLVELRQAGVAVRDADARNTIRAPVAGVVDRLAFAAPGTIVPGGETILEIVPQAGDLRVTARVSPADVARLAPGQAATVRLGAGGSAAPRLTGRIARIGADRQVDARTGVPSFAVDVTLDRAAPVAAAAAAAAAADQLRLRPGLPAEVFLRTGRHTLLAWLLRPLADQFARAFR